MPDVGHRIDDDEVKKLRPGRAGGDSTERRPLPAGGAVEGDMHTEEPLGWDQAPLGIRNPRHKRHSRPDGIGGLTPAIEDPADEKKTG